MVDVVDFVGEHMNKHQVRWKVLDAPVDIYYCGLGVAKNSAGVKDWLNVAIFELHRRGRTDELWKKWFGIEIIKTCPGNTLLLSPDHRRCGKRRRNQVGAIETSDGLYPPFRTDLAVSAASLTARFCRFSLQSLHSTGDF